MNNRDDYIREYQDWLLDLVSHGYCPYSKLLTMLHFTTFKWTVPRDENRAADGVSLRTRFIFDRMYDYDSESVYSALDGPCSMLEMMIALAMRIEDNIMDDPQIGDRTAQWFWEMVANMGLNGQTDQVFNEEEVYDILTRFFNHEYEFDGRGSLFHIPGTTRDLRYAEIWYQANWYLDDIMG